MCRGGLSLAVPRHLTEQKRGLAERSKTSGGIEFGLLFPISYLNQSRLRCQHCLLQHICKFLCHLFCIIYLTFSPTLFKDAIQESEELSDTIKSWNMTNPLFTSSKAQLQVTHQHAVNLWSRTRCFKPWGTRSHTHTRTQRRVQWILFRPCLIIPETRYYAAASSKTPEESKQCLGTS